MLNKNKVRAYNAGFVARNQDKGQGDNPYPYDDEGLRTAWFAGWNNADMRLRGIDNADES